MFTQLTKRQTNQSQQGDTLVEVTIAMAVLGLILAATMTVINHSLLGVSNAVERTSIRGAVNSQMELIRYVFDTQTGLNKDTVKKILTITKDKSAAGDIANRGCKMASGGFYLTTGSSAKPVTFNNYTNNQDDAAANVWSTPLPGNGVWIEGVKSGSGSNGLPGYVDFYVRACWTPRGTSQTGQGRLESAVRVYYREGL